MVDNKRKAQAFLGPDHHLWKKPESAHDDTMQDN
jgi:hypothetical protein